jgi:uncharacterized glyoxalase superfamily protein PhnB
VTNGHTFGEHPVRGRFYGVVPVFLVDDVGAAAEYYRDVLGFEVEFLYGDDPTYGRVTRDDAIIDFARAEPAGARNSVKAGGSTFGVDAVVVVSDIDDVYIEIQEKGANVIERLAAREYGALDCTIEDLNGYRLTISGDLEEDEDDDA